MSANITPYNGTAITRGQVLVHKDANHSGAAWLVVGNVYDFRNVSGLNDQISSVQVGPNTKAFLFEDDRYNGNILRLNENESVADLTTRNFNDKASSIIIATFDSA